MALKKTFSIEIDGIQSAVTNVKALKEAQEATEKAFQEADFGTAEYARLGKQLQGLETELEKVKISTDALSGADRVEGFVRFGSAITGVVGSASLLSSALGNSSEELQQAEAKLGAFLATMQTLKAVQEAVGKENKFLTSLLSRFGATTSSVAAATEKQTIAQRVLNLVMKANPIGLIITAIGVLIGLFALVANNIDTLRAKFAPAFEFIEGLIDNVVGKFRDLASLLSGGFIRDAATAKDLANSEAIVAGLDKISAARQRELELDKLRGVSEFERTAKQLKGLSDEIKALEALSFKRKLTDEENTKLKDKEFEREKLQEEQAAAFRTKSGEQLAKNRERERRDAERNIALLEAQGASESVLFQARQALLAKDLQRYTELRKQRELNADEEEAVADLILKIQIDRLKEQKRLDEKAFAEAVARNAQIKIEREKANAELVKGIEEISKVKQPTITIGIETNEAEVTDKVGALANNILDKYQEVMETKGAEVFQQVGGQAVNVLGDLFAQQVDRASEQLEYVKEAIAQTEAQLQESADRTNNLEEQLTNSRGQRREFLIAQIEKEREREKVLEAQKKSQAKEEAKRQQEIDKIRRRAAILQKVLNIAEAVQAGGLAVLRALSSTPSAITNIVLASVVGGLAAAQVGLIAAQKFAMGGKVKRGYELDGFPAYGDNTLALVRPGEVILNESQQVRIGGPAALRKAGVPGFAGGGLASMNLTPPPPMNLDFAAINGSSLAQANNASELRKLGDRIEAMRIVVQPQQVVNEANRMTEIQNRGTI